MALLRPARRTAVRPGHSRYREVGHDGGVTTTRRVAVLAPMRPELKAVVRAGGLSRTSDDAVFSHEGSAGIWSGRPGCVGRGPAVAREATERVLERGPFDHVIVVGIAGGLDPALPVGSLMVP